MPTYVATYRAAFDAETEGVAQVTAERGLEALENILGEEDDEGDESYKLQLTEVVKFDHAKPYDELADECFRLRNKLIATKIKKFIEAAGVLDETGWYLTQTIDPTDAESEVLPQYPRYRLLEVCQAIWERGENPTT